MSDVIVIGGGAAGMMAALTAGQKGHSVTLLEKNEKLGKKIYITGKGRCNFTNACDFPVFISNIVSNPRFMYSSGRAYGPADITDLLEEAGCRTKVERGNRAFPVSDHASDVTKALEKCLREAGVKILLNTKVTGIQKDGQLFFVKTAGKQSFRADAVIICTGGLSYPSTGSDGDGYHFARDFGLSVTDCYPALVPLTVKEDALSGLQGVSLKNVSVKIYESEESVSADSKGPKCIFESEPGELLFTHFGLSGPLILTASSLVTGRLSGGKTYSVSIDLKPGLSFEMLDERILRDLSERNNMDIQNALGKLLIASLRPLVLRKAEIDPKLKARDLSRKQRLKLIQTIKDLSFIITGTRGFNEAVITQGGVGVSQIDPRTMEAKNCAGLYFAGEVLDIDAYTGGFNLQIAWSTGHAAGSGIR